MACWGHDGLEVVMVVMEVRSGREEEIEFWSETIVREETDQVRQIAG